MAVGGCSSWADAERSSGAAGCSSEQQQQQEQLRQRGQDRRDGLRLRAAGHSLLLLLPALLLLLCMFNFPAGANASSVTNLAPQPSPAKSDLDPHGNVVITYNVLGWTTDGYTAQVNISNQQAYRGFDASGWFLSWNWTQGEYIWSMLGAEAAMQGDCANKTSPGGTSPHCCLSTPTIIDLLPTAADDLKVANCCRGGVLRTWTQKEWANETTSIFQMTVGGAGNTAANVSAPSGFSLGADYKCAAPVSSTPTLYPADSGRRLTQALVTWTVNCTYNQPAAEPVPGCCVSLSTFYNTTVTPCATCACACGSFSSSNVMCNTGTTNPYLTPAEKNITSTTAPYARECSADGCPTSIHWHIEENYYNYWEVLVTITNRMAYQTYSDWLLALEHPSMNNITSVTNANTTNILPYGVNNTAVLYGLTDYTDTLAVAPGYLQFTLLLGKQGDFTLKDGWAFPRSVVFNGQTCVMPATYPTLPNASAILSIPVLLVSLLAFAVASLLSFS